MLQQLLLLAGPLIMALKREANLVLEQQLALELRQLRS
jgi:hypothetical protein